MNEMLDRIIKQNGEMWADVRDRTDSPVLLSLTGRPLDKVYELTLPKGEGHPFWRISERHLTTEEAADLQAQKTRMRYEVGDLQLAARIGMEGYFALVQAYVFNGRVPRWNCVTEDVKVTIGEYVRP
jgi:hypothetical protein